MSDPIAVSILAKLTSYWTCNGNLNDSHGSNHIASGLSSVAYEAGMHGQRLKANARGYDQLASAIAINAGTALTIGGLFTYDGSSSVSGCISLSDNFLAQNEVLALNVNALLSRWSASSWAGAPTNYGAQSGAVSIAYPVTIQVRDASGDTASSAQIINIATPGGITAGATYHVIGTWEGEYLHVYINGTLRGSTTPPRPALTKTQALYFQIGNQFGPAQSPCASEELLLCGAAAFNAGEVAWLYNGGFVRTYTDILAAAA